MGCCKKQKLQVEEVWLLVLGTQTLQNGEPETLVPQQWEHWGRLSAEKLRMQAVRSVSETVGTA